MNPTIWQDTLPIEGLPTGGPLIIGLQCRNMPTDGFIAFSVPGPDPQNSIDCPKSAITQANYTVSYEVNWPAGFNSTMTYSYYPGPTPPPPGASISPIVASYGSAGK